MDAPSTRASNCEEADEDDGTIVSDTELSDLSDSSVPKETCTDKLSASDEADQPEDPPKSEASESEWISSHDKPDPSQKPTPCQKRPHIDDEWSDGECSLSKTQRRRRHEYTYADKKAIVDYISQTKSYNKVKGRQLWETMADTKVCPGRTWQSLKEHYRKQIIPNIATFGLPMKIVRLFLAPFPRYRHVHFEDNSLKRPEKEFKKNGESENANARHVTDPPQSFDSADDSDRERSDLSLRKESEIQNKSSPEMSSPGTPDMENEWLSACDKIEISEDSIGVSEGSQNKFNDVYAEEILKLIGNSDSAEWPPNSSSEIDTPKDGPAIGSEPPELFSEAPTEREGTVHALETERTQITNTPPGTEERPLDEHSEAVLGLPSCYDGVPKLPASDVPTEEMREANITEIEEEANFTEIEEPPVAADGHLTAEENSLDENFEIETISGIPSIDEEALILPIRKRTFLNPQPCTPRTEQPTSVNPQPCTPQRTEQPTSLNPQPCTPQRTEQPTTTEAQPLTPSKWPAIKIVRKSARKSPVKNSATKPESISSEEFLFRKRREYTYEDKKAIVNHISQTQSYNRVKGRQFWQSMVEQKVCPGRTWQSLKEHYIKQIIPNLCVFRLSEEEERKFLAPFV